MPVVVLVAAVAVSAGAALLLYALVPSGANPRASVAHNLRRGQSVDLREIVLAAPARERAARPLVTSLASFGRRLSPAGAIARLERKYVLAGRPQSLSVERLLAAKIVLGSLGGLLLLSRVSSGSGLTGILVAGVFGLLLYTAPDVFISSRATERQRAILHELPDALDQMTICMEAGLAFEAAMARVSQSNAGPLAQEIVRMLQEIQVGVGRRHALGALADRNDVADLRHFVSALQQAESYGVPIARVLKDQARELRAKRRQRAEEAARKLPLKLLMPLVVFILPPLFIVLIGPAAISVAKTFGILG